MLAEQLFCSEDDVTDRREVGERAALGDAGIRPGPGHRFPAVASRIDTPTRYIALGSADERGR